MKWLALPSWFLVLLIKPFLRANHPINRIKLLDDWVKYRTGLFKAIDVVAWCLLALLIFF